jgi:hypothetical protein
MLGKVLLGLTHGFRVLDFGVVQALRLEHLAKQTSVSRIVFNQKKVLDQFLPHLPYLFGANLVSTPRKSLMLLARLSNVFQVQRLIIQRCTLSLFVSYA